MTEYPPQISLPFIGLGNVYWSANLLNLLTNQAQNDLHIIKHIKGGCMVKSLTSLRTLCWFMSIAIHSGRDCCRYKHRH